MRAHTGERPYQCPNCSYASPDTFSLKRHLRTHTGEKSYTCDICDARFSQSNSLKIHRTIHNQDRPTNKCELCPATLKTTKSLNLHVEKFHTSEHIMICKKCGKKCQDKYTLRAHDKSHTGEKCFKCALCPFSSVSQIQQKLHSVIHSDQKPFECDQCTQRFKWKQMLKRHKNQQHNPLYVQPSPKKNIFQCPDCDKCFKSKGSLLKHFASHEYDNIEDRKLEVVDNNTIEEDMDATQVIAMDVIIPQFPPLPDNVEDGEYKIVDNGQQMVPPNQVIEQQHQEDLKVKKELERLNNFGF